VALTALLTLIMLRLARRPAARQCLNLNFRHIGRHA